MRTLLTLALPVVLLLSTPALAQMQSQSRDRTSTGSGMTNPSREVDASDVTPSRNLIGKPITYRYQGGTAGTIRDVVTGDDGRPKLVMETRDTRRQVVLDLSEVRRRGNGVQLMIDPEQVAGLPDFQGQGSMGTMGRSMGNTPGATGR
ncbi:hypothetical protein [Azospirillum sp. sgz301742]